MTPILIICAVVAGISIYDYLNTRSWQQVTSAIRNEAVFEKRNKSYGAFQIRRNYNRTLGLILIGMTGGVGIIYAATNASAKAFKSKVEIPVAELETIEMNFNEKQPEQEVAKPKEAAPKQQADMQKSVEVTPTDDPNKNQKVNIDPKNAGPEDKKGNGDPFTPIPDPRQSAGEGDGKDPLPPITDDPQIPDIPAEFPGGMGKMKPFLAENVKYPQEALEELRGGKVYVRFIVDKEGEISDVTVIRKSPDCPECDAEAKRVIRRMPKWTPGKKNGKPVKTYFNIPVSFMPG